MTLAHDLNTAHIARLNRLWPVQRKAAVAAPKPVKATQEPYLAPETPVARLMDKHRAYQAAAIAREAQRREQRQLNILPLWSPAETAILTLDPLSMIQIRATMAGIMAAVIAETRVTRERLTGKSRTVYNCKARNVFCWLARRQGISYPRIGAMINRDHSTVMHAYRCVESNFALYTEMIEAVEKRLGR